jgi:hypothetical protein
VAIDRRCRVFMVGRMISWVIVFLDSGVKVHRFCAQSWIDRLTSVATDDHNLFEDKIF